MHSQRLQRLADEYLGRVDTRSGDRWTRGEVHRHLIGFAEVVLRDYGRGAEPVAGVTETSPSASGNNQAANVPATAGTTPGAASNPDDCKPCPHCGMWTCGFAQWYGGHPFEWWLAQPR